VTGNSEPAASLGLPGQPELSAEEARRLLELGELDVQGRIVGASNATLFCVATLDGISAMCVHKPVAGERPLWDFPDGTLADREVATYVVSEATGWDIVPPTVLREGPFGPGMCQLWVDVDETVDLGLLVGSDHDDLARMVVLDAVVNNADRKGGHVLPRADGRVQGIDHGVTFNPEDKLRTVLWDWRGEPLADEAVDVLSRLEPQLDVASDGPLACALEPLLTRREIVRTRVRVRRLLRDGVYPHPRGEWPPVPWPAF
jgi:uncharacterized repeat protein (TIGR03843 family)